MNQTGKILIIMGGLLLFFRKKTFASPGSTGRTGLSRFPYDTQKKIITLESKLRAAGFNDLNLKFALAQLLHETGGFSSKSQVAALNNNFSGITWINKPYQRNATRGTAKPRSEGGYYAKFDTLQDWANDFHRILSLGQHKPINAPDLKQYVTRLASNRYFFPNSPKYVNIYYKGMDRYINYLS